VANHEASAAQDAFFLSQFEFSIAAQLTLSGLQTYLRVGVAMHMASLQENQYAVRELNRSSDRRAIRP
jgi:hypothetical protein